MPRTAKTTKAANKSRVQKAKALHEANTRTRKKDIEGVQAIYAAEKDGPLLQDILAMGHKYIEYHNKVAQDGVGSRKTGHKLTNGEDEFEVIYLTNDQRASHLDKSAGIQELIDSIERKIDPPTVSKPQ